MKVAYFNDRDIPAFIGIESLNSLTEVQPCELKYFELKIEANRCLFIKVWNTNVVLIGTTQEKE